MDTTCGGKQKMNLAMWIKFVVIRQSLPMMAAMIVLIFVSQAKDLFDHQSSQAIPVIEGGVFPVATNREFWGFEKTDWNTFIKTNSPPMFKEKPETVSGVAFNVRYYKNPGCEILGVNWHAGDQVILPIVSGPPKPHIDKKDEGWQDAGRWFIRVDKLEGTTATLLSLCENERLRISPFYPSDLKE